GYSIVVCNESQNGLKSSSSNAAFRQFKSISNAASQVRRAYRISRRRDEKIEKLREILVENPTEVSASDKKAALLYCRCLLTLQWLNLTHRRIPLFEGIRALYESKLIYSNESPNDWVHIDIEGLIELLPTRSETTPQTEQSSLNVSA